MISNLSRLVIAGLAGLSLTAGCASSVTLNHYILSSHAIQNRGNVQPDTLAQLIALGPITLPEMLDRPQLVLRTNEHRVAFTETHRWAGPLKTEISRVLTDNLAYLLKDRLVLPYPQQGTARADVRVSVDIQRFESILGKTATIDAVWTINRKNGALQTNRTYVQEAPADESYDALVAAHSRALMTVSQEIASAIQGGGVAAPLH